MDMKRHLILLAALLCFNDGNAAETAEARAASQATANYVFAGELGSGIYDVSGRTLQVYRLPLSWDLRPPAPQRPGLSIIAPLTLGFFDFELRDVLSFGVPSSVDSFSLLPGIEARYLLRDDWQLVPYAQIGVSVVNGKSDGMLYGTGVAIEHQRWHPRWRLLREGELTLASADFRDDRDVDHFARLRAGAEARHSVGRPWREHQIELGAYAMLDVIADPPRLPVPGSEPEVLQMESGVTLGTRDALRIWWGIPLPRLGIGYRFAGDYSSWRLVFGAPF